MFFAHKKFPLKMAIFAVKIFFLDPSKGPPFDFQKVDFGNFSSDPTFSPKVLKVASFDPKFYLEPELRIKLNVWRSWACLFCKTPVFQGPKRSFLGVQKHLKCQGVVKVYPKVAIDPTIKVTLTPNSRFTCPNSL